MLKYEKNKEKKEKNINHKKNTNKPNLLVK